MSNTATDHDAVVKAAIEFQREAMKASNSKYKPDNPETLVKKHSRQFVINNTDRVKFFKSQGVSPEAIEKHNAVESSWRAASAQIAAEELVDATQEALQDKEFMAANGIKHLNACVKTFGSQGNEQVIVNAYSENTNPRERDKITQSYGSVTVRAKVTKPFSPDIATQIATNVEQAIRGKF